MATRGSLDLYRKKRDFSRTREPAGRLAPGPGGRFVVHEHHATSLHYDLRLEMGGVLKSWAVPKGPTLDPKVKRLAIQTEDHPVQYLGFEGDIAHGQYGAGEVRVWDAGAYSILPGGDPGEAWSQGRLHVDFQGGKLKGAFMLVRTARSPKQWLLFKVRDGEARSDWTPVPILPYGSRNEKPGIGEAAKSRSTAGKAAKSKSAPEGPPGSVPASLPAFVPPMLAVLVDKSFDDPDWVFETKWDGWRALLRFDGEVVALDAGGRSRFQLLQNRLKGRRSEGGAASMVYYAFDLLHLDGLDLTGCSLLDRKRLLRSLLPDDKSIRYSDHTANSGVDACEEAVRHGFEGVVAKRARAPYAKGRSADWLKPRECVRESEQSASDLKAAAESAAGPAVTHPEKVYFPGEGITKGDLIRYYDKVSPWMLPHLKDRPLILKRFPEGIAGASFHQHNLPNPPPFLETVEEREEARGTLLRYALCQNRESLIHLANMGVISMHPFLSRVPRLDRPDFTVFDLDPQDVPFREVCRLAVFLGSLLESLGLAAFAKTSGSSGIHVFVPLKPSHTWEQSLRFAQEAAAWAALERPDAFTLERSLKARPKSRIYLDCMQNARGKSVACAYSARARPGATVSAPVAWEELKRGVRTEDFDLETMPARLRKRGDLFAGALQGGNSLPDAMRKLEGLLGTVSGRGSPARSRR